MKRNISVCIILLLVLFPSPVHADNVSIQSVRFDVSPFNFTSTVFIQGVLAEFNTTDPNANWTVFTSMDTQKIVGGGTRTLSIRFLFDGVILIQEEVRTFSDNDLLGTTGIRPTRFSVGPVGQHNITVEFALSGPGTVEVSNIDIVAVKDRVFGSNNSIRQNLTQIDTSFTATEFDKIANWSMPKNISSTTFIVQKWSLFKTVNDDANVTFFSDGGTVTDSPFFQRYLEDNSDIGSVGMAYIDAEEGTTHVHSIQARQSDVGATVSINGSIFETDLRDNSSGLVNNFQLSRGGTNITNTTQFGSGISNILNTTVTMRNGTAYLITASASFGSSSDDFTPRFFINSSNSTLTQCSSGKRRSIASNEDTGNTYMFMVCQNMTGIGDSYDFGFYVEVPTGETLILKDESFGGFEVTPFDTLITQVDQDPPQITIISPLNDTINASPTLFNITVFDESDVSCNVSVNGTASIALTNSSGNYNTQIFLEDGPHNATVSCVDIIGNANTTDILWFTIDTTPAPTPSVWADLIDSTDEIERQFDNITNKIPAILAFLFNLLIILLLFILFGLFLMLFGKFMEKVT